jgi:hypothetical protein
VGRTAEVRWFFEGRPPVPAVQWFENLGAQPQERTDAYLRLLETDALGVKIRGGGGSLELKLRERSHGERELVDGVDGSVEEWQKWSFEMTGNEPPARGLGLPAQLWLEVTKVRRLAMYAPPSWTPSLPEGRPVEGCGVELTGLRVGGQEWSTLGFEAFGSEDRILESLTRATSEFFGELELPHGLGADASCGYPGWLQRVAQHPALEHKSALTDAPSEPFLSGPL